jgi:protein TonB
MQTKTAKKNWRRHLPFALGVIAVLAALAIGILFKEMFQLEKAEQKKQIQQVTIIAPPPPPPPPKEEIREPEVTEEIPEEQPEAAAPDDNSEDAPAGETLGVDAEGGAGGDGFGLVGRKGGRGLLGGIGGYEQVVRQEINEAVVGHERLRHMEYVAIVSLRLADSGEFEKFDIEMVSGGDEARALLEEVLRRKQRISRPRPLEAASLVRLRVKSIL